MAEQQEHSTDTNKTSIMDVLAMILGVLMFLSAGVRAYEWISSDLSDTESPAAVTLDSKAVDGADTTRASSQVMTDADSHMAESILAFKLAGISFVGSIIILLVFGGLLRLAGLAGAVGAIGLGMTVLQMLLGLQHYAKAEMWSKQAIEYLSWGYVGIVMILLVWWGVWAKLQEP